MSTAPDPAAVRRGGIAGALAPAVFLGGLLLLDLLAGRVDVSGHELGPRGWLMHLVFVVFGLLLLAFAVGLGRHLRGRRGGRTASVLVGVFAVGALLGTATPDPDDPHTWHGMLHFAGFLLVTLVLLPAMVAFAVAVRRDARWRGFAWGSGVAAVVTAVVVFAPGTSSGSDYALWTGPASMLELLLLGAWIEVVALRLVRVAGQERSDDGKQAAARALTS